MFIKIIGKVSLSVSLSSCVCVSEVLLQEDKEYCKFFLLAIKSLENGMQVTVSDSLLHGYLIYVIVIY